MDLGPIFSTVASVIQNVMSTPAGIEITPLDGSGPIPLDAVVQKEKADWRIDRSGDRHLVYTVRVKLPLDADEVSVGAGFTIGDRAYTVEASSRDPKTGSQRIHGIRYEAAATSHPGAWS